MLIDRNIYKKDLETELNISSATIGNGESVSMDVLERICRYINCDIMSFGKLDREEVPSNSSK